jgi:hypothetical protein
VARLQRTAGAGAVFSRPHPSSPHQAFIAACMAAGGDFRTTEKARRCEPGGPSRGQHSYLQTLETCLSLRALSQ